MMKYPFSFASPLALPFLFFMLVSVCALDITSESWRLWPDNYRQEFQGGSSHISSFFTVGDAVLFAWNGRLCEFSHTDQERVHVFEPEFTKRWDLRLLLVTESHAFLYDNAMPDAMQSLYRVDAIGSGPALKENSVAYEGNVVRIVKFSGNPGSLALLIAMKSTKKQHATVVLGEKVYFANRNGLQSCDLLGDLVTLSTGPSYGMLMGAVHRVSPSSVSTTLIGYGPSMDDDHLHQNCVWAFTLENGEYEILHVLLTVSKDTMHPVTMLQKDEYGKAEILFAGFDMPHSRWLVYRSDGTQNGTSLLAELCYNSMSPFKCLGVFLSDKGDAWSSHDLLAVRGGISGSHRTYYLLEDAKLVSVTESLDSQNGDTIEQRRFQRGSSVFPNVAILRDWIGARLIYSAIHEERGRELWINNGKQGRMVGDLADGPTDSRVQIIGSLGSTVLVTGFDKQGETHFWVSDGTDQGTVQVFDSNISPDRLRAVRIDEHTIAVPSGSIARLQTIAITEDGSVHRMYGSELPGYIRAAAPPIYTEKEGAWLHVGGVSYYVYSGYAYNGFLTESGAVPHVLRIKKKT